ncbi:MAG: hypothetical protein A2514_14195 [Gammaproteobacteria bacterium RIFOXYD12_FULL_61_37]|nr:MAG: hypothetical protein A2514_14195 [Gammaproteobacteria bacterium RIFOXYD12_FULL_61_37]
MSLSLALRRLGLRIWLGGRDLGFKLFLDGRSKAIEGLERLFEVPQWIEESAALRLGRAGSNQGRGH